MLLPPKRAQGRKTNRKGNKNDPPNLNKNWRKTAPKKGARKLAVRGWKMAARGAGTLKGEGGGGGVPEASRTPPPLYI